MAPLGAALVERGWHVIAPDLRRHLDSPTSFAKAASAAASGRAIDVVVGHSGAGSMLPLIAARTGEATSVFIDAVVPGDSPQFTPSDRFVELLERIPVDDGLLVPWHRWWPPETMTRLLPDAGVRAAIEAEVPRVPRGFYELPVDVPAGWWHRPAVYLQLSAGYDEERSQADCWGWPTSRIDGGHLDLVVAPELVVGQLLELIDRLPERALRFEPEGDSS